MIGVDFDNTIVCYDELFYKVAIDMGFVSETVGKSKTAVRDHVRAQQTDDKWTVLQAEVYGARLLEAPPYPGVIEFFRQCRNHSLPACIVSHKSQLPAAGKAYDLHRSALSWLEVHGFFAADGIQLSHENVHFTPSREEKIEKISQLRCSHFIDDLPEVFNEIGFSTEVEQILFDPAHNYPQWNGGVRVSSWTEIQRRLVDQIAV